MSTHQRAMSVVRAGQSLTLSFGYHPELVGAVKTLPYAAFDPETKTWTVPLCTQTVNSLRAWDHNGWTTPSIDELVDGEETLPVVAGATLRAGSAKRPYTVSFAGGDDTVFARLRAVPGSTWDKKSRSLTYPPAAGAALADLVASGTLDDPDELIGSHDATIMYDTRIGACTLLGEASAVAVFNTHYPHTDVYEAWRAKGLDVGFLDHFSEAMYRGEIVRHHGAEAPEGLNVTLYPFQKVNAKIAALRDGHAVFDEPGLGKTITGIAAGLWRLQAGAVRTVVVCPAAVRTQWANEIRTVTGDEDISVITGSAKKREQIISDALENKHRWIICHYDILSRDKKMLTDLFTGAYIIADEAHRIKSPEAARTKALRALSAGSVARLALTGTPVETSPAEWYDILSGWVHPGVLGGAIDFNERYRWKNRWGGYEGARNVSELRNRSAALYTRHTKKEVAKHLPPLQVQQQSLDPDTAYAAALRRAHADAANEIRAAAVDKLAKHTNMRTGQNLLLDGSGVADAETAADMTAVGLLRLMCSSPRLVLQSESAAAQAMKDAGLVPDQDGPKVEYLRTVAAGLKATQDRRLAENGKKPAEPADVMDERMVIFTFSERMARLLSERFNEDGVPNVLFTGQTSADARDRAVAAFTSPESDVVAFISTDAGAEGLNLGKCCSLLINADLAWTASKMAQRAQRIHRVDSTAAHYHVINLTLTGTLEAGIVKMLESRADLTDALFGEHGSRARTTGRRQRRGEHNLLEEALQAGAEGLGEGSDLGRKNSGKLKAEVGAVDNSADLGEKGGDVQLNMLD